MLAQKGEPQIYVVNNDTNIIYIPKKANTAPYLIFEKKTKIAFKNLNAPMPYRQRLLLDNNMRNVVYSANIERDGKVLRAFPSQKEYGPAINSNQKALSAPKLSSVINIPYIDNNEDICITLRYEWMDPRWLLPIMLEESLPTKDAVVSIEVPYGITMNFQASVQREPITLMPYITEAVESTLWGDGKHHKGPGSKYIFKYSNNLQKNENKNLSDLMQLYVSFESPFSSNQNSSFDSWNKLSSFIYNKIDRFDAPQASIEKLSEELVKGEEKDDDKIRSVFNYLKEKIENQCSDVGFMFQEVGPAPRTFVRKYGTPFDLAILGKAMLSSLGIESQILLVSNVNINPKIDFFTPSIFNDVILAVIKKDKKYYFNPKQKQDNFSSLSWELQGQKALIIDKDKGQIMNLPFDPAEKNQKKVQIELELNRENELNGFFLAELSGLVLNEFKTLVGVEQTIINPAKAQGALFGQMADFAILELQKEGADIDQKMALSGSFKTLKLNKTNEDTFSIPINELLNMLRHNLLSIPNFSKEIEISIKIKLSADITVKEIAKNNTLSFNGGMAQVLVNQMPEQIIIKSKTSISLPLEKHAEDLEDIRSFTQNLEKPLILSAAKAKEVSTEKELNIFKDKEESDAETKTAP